MHSGRFLVGITEQMASKLEPSLFQVTLSTGNRLTESNNPLKVFIMQFIHAAKLLRMKTFPTPSPLAVNFS